MYADEHWETEVRQRIKSDDEDDNSSNNNNNSSSSNNIKQQTTAAATAATTATTATRTPTHTDTHRVVAQTRDVGLAGYDDRAVSARVYNVGVTQRVRHVADACRGRQRPPARYRHRVQKRALSANSAAGTLVARLAVAAVIAGASSGVQTLCG